MKRIMILLLSSFLILIVLSACIGNQKTEIPQPTKIPTNTAYRTPSVSSTPTRTQEVYSNRLTDTPEPSKSITPIPVTLAVGPTSTTILDGELIALRAFNINYLEDILTGRGYNLLAEGKAIDILRWEGNGCTLIAATRDDIIEMNLKGDILHSIFPFERIHDIVDGYLLIDPPYYRRAIDMLSPDKYWLVYRMGSGNYEERGDDIEPYRFEYENLETMSVDGSQGPYRLSQNGGAWRAAWSPDSQQIAFSDYDDQGVHQLFLISRNGANRKQMTSFSNPLVEIMKIIWSPNGDKIALLVDQDDDSSDDETIVLNIDENTYPREFENIFTEWWRDNNSFVAWKIIEREPRHAEIIILDTSTNNEVTIRPEGCYRINTFGNPSMVGCLTDDDKFMVYDTNTSNIIEYPNFKPLIDTQYWIAAPDAYQGAKECGFTQ